MSGLALNLSSAVSSPQEHLIKGFKTWKVWDCISLTSSCDGFPLKATKMCSYTMPPSYSQTAIFLSPQSHWVTRLHTEYHSIPMGENGGKRRGHMAPEDSEFWQNEICTYTTRWPSCILFDVWLSVENRVFWGPIQLHLSLSACKTVGGAAWNLTLKFIRCRQQT